MFRKPQERLCHCPDRFVSPSDEEEVEAGYMFTPEEYQKLKFENADVTKLKNSEVRVARFGLSFALYVFFLLDCGRNVRSR